MKKYEGLEGTKFNRWNILHIDTDSKTPRYICKCECGTIKSISAYTLLESSKCQSKSCGCHKSEEVKARMTKHGYANDNKRPKEYDSWVNMRQRCANPNHVKYDMYGGRGITVCDEWNDFENFISDMGFRPSKNHTIDRIDNEKGYYKENCRWATKSDQVINQRIRPKNKTGVVGVYFNNKSGKFRAKLTLKGNTHYLGEFDTLEKAKQARLEAEVKYFGREIKR